MTQLCRPHIQTCTRADVMYRWTASARYCRKMENAHVHVNTQRKAPGGSWCSVLGHFKWRYRSGKFQTRFSYGFSQRPTGRSTSTLRCRNAVVHQIHTGMHGRDTDVHVGLCLNVVSVASALILLWAAAIWKTNNVVNRLFRWCVGRHECDPDGRIKLGIHSQTLSP